MFDNIRRATEKLISAAPLAVMFKAMELFMPAETVFRVMPSLIKTCGFISLLAVILCYKRGEPDAADSATETTDIEG